MKHFSQKELAELPSRFRANLINCCTGFKSANLIGSISESGTTNLAVFSSVVHLGANPPLYGFILRPLTVARHSFENIKTTGVFTINAITKQQIAAAHGTAAKYPKDVSEFNKTGLKPIFKNEFRAPYVEDAPIQIGLRYEEDHYLKINDTRLVIGSIEELYVRDGLVLDDGAVQLSDAEIVSIIGLDGYATSTLIDRFEYAKPDQQIKSKKQGYDRLI